MNYYYQKNGESYGPISIDDIVKIIDENTLVSDSSKEWKVAKDVPEMLALLIASGVVKPTIKKVPPPPPPSSKSNISSSSPAIPPNFANNTIVNPLDKGAKDFNTSTNQNNTGRKNSFKKGIGIPRQLLILGVIAALIFFVGDLYYEKKQADEREYNKAHGIKFVGQGNDDSHSNNKEDDEDVSGSSSSNSSHNSNETNSDNKNDDPTLGIVGHKKWCDCAECDKIRDDNGKNGNAMGGSQHAWEESAKQEKSTGKIICPNCKGTGKAKSTCDNCNGTGSRTVSGSDIDPACHGTGEIFGVCKVCKGKGRVAEHE